MPEFVLCILAVTTVLLLLILVPDILKLNKEIAELKEISKELDAFNAKVVSRTETSLEDLEEDHRVLNNIKARLNAIK